MALLEVSKEESAKGFEKTLDVNSTALILENLQKFQYKYPIDSTVREVVSNAVDSIREKNIAKKIIQGQAKIEDYFQTEEGEIYESSKFDFNYYDLKYLSDDDITYLTYKTGSERDEFIIQDNGVGLGGSRLEGFFQLAYSSKRLSKATLGRYGLGAKAPLSTGCDSFIVESVYNGKKFKFEVFTHKVDSLVGKWNDSGKNNSIKFSNGFECYYEDTTELNRVTITIPVKKHNKHKFIQAVEKQLMYIPESIIFNIIEGDYKRQRDFKAKVLFETDDILISQNNYFTRPHIVLNNTVYGFIDFEELELETRYGSVGFKVNVENIDISPSREEVLWTPKTKAEILSKYQAITETAEEYINKELKDLDYFNWILKANALSRNSNSGPLYHLSKICNVSSVSLKWDKDPSKTYALDFNQMWGKSWSIDSVTTGYNGKPIRNSSTSVNAFCNNYSEKTLYIKDCNYQGKMVPYLATDNSLVILYKREGIIRDYLYNNITLEELEELIEDLPEGISKNSIVYDFKMLKFLLSLNVKRLSELEIPDDFITQYSENETETGETEIIKDTKKAYKDLRAARKANGEITVSLIDGNGSHRSILKLANLQSSNYCVFGTQENKSALMDYSERSNVPVYMVAKNNLKHFTLQTCITDIKPSISNLGVLKPHKLVNSYIKYLIFNSIIANLFPKHNNYYTIESINLIVSNIEELKDVLKYKCFTSSYKTSEVDMIIKYYELCINSEMNIEDIFNSNEEFLKNLYPGDYKSIKCLTDTELDLFRRYVAFLETYKPLFISNLPNRALNKNTATLDMITLYLDSKRSEYGYDFTFSYNY